MTVPAVPAARLPPLRQELALWPAEAAADGSPAWTLQDPATGRFLRVGWPEFEMLRRWALGTPEAVAARIAAETTLRPTPARVLGFAEALAGTELLAVTGAAGTARLLRRQAARRRGWGSALLHNYLFFRLPLTRPDRCYAALAPRLAFLGSRGFLWLTALAGLLGLLLALRQWDVFLAGFPHLATPSGLLLGAASILLLKLLHELGHGLVARTCGCRVRTAGIAVMVFVPVLYTDLTEAWQLPDRRRRLLIGAAGIATELALACWALLAWSFLPDGPARSIAFAWATTAPLLTLLVNLNPFMRFDGYFLLSDAIGQPNLQEVSFRLGRWQLRRIVLGLSDPPPVAVPAAPRRFLVAFAWATWAWRVVLFLGIAAAVYHIAFKALGIVLAAVEIGWFVLRPVAAELAAWRRDLHRMPSMIRPVLSGGCILAVLVALVLPWRGAVPGDALVLPDKRAVLLAPEGAQVTRIVARPGQAVGEGEVVMELTSPALDHQAAALELRIASLLRQAEAQRAVAGSAGRAEILELELVAARAELTAAQTARAALSLRAPFAGVIMELADPLRAGEWVRRGEPLAVLTDPARLLVEAFVAERDLWRFAVGSAAIAQPVNPDLPAFRARVEAVDLSATRELAEAVLASTYGGPIAARSTPQGVLVPESAIYRVKLRPEGEIEASRAELASLRIEGAAESLLGRAWRSVLAVLLRESGF